mgnify:CR=1 FL=1
MGWLMNRKSKEGSRMEDKYVISVKDICKSYRQIHALNGATLDVESGRITAIVGDNGSGKSTLIKILSGTVCPDSGVISVGGEEYRSLTIRTAMELGICTVYQDLSLDNCKNSVENIFLGDEILRGPFLNRKAMREETARLLEELHVSITDLSQPVRDLSGGQRQALAIARALRRPCRLLLLDEPTAAMGIQETHQTMELLRSLRSRGMTQLIVSHNLQQVFSLADCVYVMRSGKVLLRAETGDTSPEELQSLILRREEEQE